MSDWEVTPLAGALGAELRGPALTELGPDQALEIEALLMRHHVLLFPEQSPSPEALIVFGSLFGALERHPHLENPTDGLPEGIFELSASTGGVADEWHTDLTYLESPALYSILHMVVAPEVGGDTMWSNLALAYDALSPPLRELCDGLSAIHDGEANGANESMALHPVVRTHPVSGRRILYVNEHFTRRIVELSRDESDLLLGHLTRWAASPRFTVRHRWGEGTVAMWDNRVTQHFVVGDFEAERVIHRVTVMGDRVERVGPPRWPLYTRAGGVTDPSRHDELVREWERRAARPAVAEKGSV